MAKQNIFCDKTMVKPSDEQQSLDVYCGIGNPGERGLTNQPQADINIKLGVSNLRNKGERK